MYKNFAELVEKRINNHIEKKRAAIVNADDMNTLEAIVEAVNHDILDPILIGQQTGILEKLNRLGFDKDVTIIDTQSDKESTCVMIKLFHNNEIDFIMKGKIDTKIMMKAVVNKENGLNTGNLISSIALLEIPNYHKLLLITDGGIVMYPKLEEKVQLLKNAIRYMRQIGYESPKVSILASVEKVNPKMPETIDAVLLTRMAEEGVFGECEVYGPLAFDLTVNPEAKRIKGVTSTVAADADIILVPDINTGNALTKAITFSGGSGGALIVGTRIPIIFSSRGSTKEEKYNSILMASALSTSKLASKEVVAV